MWLGWISFTRILWLPAHSEFNLIEMQFPSLDDGETMIQNDNGLNKIQVQCTHNRKNAKTC